jgi:DNA-3-methyladenine glycosylase II
MRDILPLGKGPPLDAKAASSGVFYPSRGPLDFALSCYRYHVWGEDLANWCRDGCFRRITEHAGALWLYEVRGAPEPDASPGVQIRILASSTSHGRNLVSTIEETPLKIEHPNRCKDGIGRGPLSEQRAADSPVHGGSFGVDGGFQPSSRSLEGSAAVPAASRHRVGRDTQSTAGEDAGATHIRDEVAWLFSLDEDLEAFYQFAATHDPTLDALCRALRGYRVTRAAGLFEALVTSITAQQINLPFAFKVRNRLIEAYGRTFVYQDETYYAFPEPEVIAEAYPQALRAMQFSTRKAEYIVGVAQVMASGQIVGSKLRELPNEEVIQRLCRQPGIGRWTAEWALIRALGRNNVLPADDLGVQHAAGRFYGNSRRMTAAEVRRLGERWRPWESWATYYLLAGLRLESPAG